MFAGRCLFLGVLPLLRLSEVAVAVAVAVAVLVARVFPFKKKAIVIATLVSFCFRCCYSTLLSLLVGVQNWLSTK